MGMKKVRKNPYTPNSIIIRDRFEKAYEMGLVEKQSYACADYGIALEELKQRNTRCAVGYSKDKYKTYKDEPGSFYYKFNQVE